MAFSYWQSAWRRTSRHGGAVQLSADHLARRGRQWIDKSPVAHPRCWRQGPIAGLRQAPAGSAYRPWKAIVHEANSLQDASCQNATASGGSWCFEANRERVLTLATAYHWTATGSMRSVASAKCCAARFTDWNPSHFLDVGEMTSPCHRLRLLFDQLSADGQEIQAIIEKEYASLGDAPTAGSGRRTIGTSLSRRITAALAV